MYMYRKILLTEKMVGKSFKTIVITPTNQRQSDFSPMSQVVGFHHIEPKKRGSSPNDFSLASKSPLSYCSVSPSMSAAGGDRYSPKSPMGSPPSNCLLGDKHYAGAKFSDPPNPTSLPKPPSHWMGPEERRRRGKASKQAKSAPQYPQLFSPANVKVAQKQMINHPFESTDKPMIVGDKSCMSMTNHLKLLLKVQA